MRLLYWTVLALAALLLALFAASNRETVAVALWPLSFALELPLYLALLLTLLAGLVLGALAAWIGGRHWRIEARRCRRRLAALESELAATQAQLPGPEISRPPSPSASGAGEASTREPPGLASLARRG